MQEYDVYFHDKKIQYSHEHELFYTTMTGQSVWLETVWAKTKEEAFRLAREQHFVNCIRKARFGAIVSPPALSPKYMYIDDNEGVGCVKYVPHPADKI